MTSDEILLDGEERMDKAVGVFRDQLKALDKRVKELAEDARVACRNVRRDANKALEQSEKAGDLTEDDLDKGKEEVQKLLKTYEAKIDELADKKSKEILEQ